jgi:hypothetical protein
VLDKRYAERDVDDVERLVREAIAAIGDVPAEEQDQLVVGGIFLVRRVARALPPEASLAEALKQHLAEGLAALRADYAGSRPSPTGTPSRHAA